MSHENDGESDGPEHILDRLWRTPIPDNYGKIILDGVMMGKSHDQIIREIRDATEAMIRSN